MTKKIMLLGTGSNVGKSLLATALCRVFRQDGYKVAPFKSQNMALNSFVTKDGGEIGRAQAAQAEAAGIEPSVHMNPVLLKPTGETGCQVVVLGKAIGNMSARDYYAYKPTLRGQIANSINQLEAEFDTIVIEGAGSPAEINLRENDIVNMGIAEMANASCLLIGDIDRGGVFAALYGTLLLLTDAERARIKGIIINKFRGDIELLKPGLIELEKLTGVPVIGVVPHIEIDIDDEDSLSERLRGGTASEVDIAVIRFAHISNFTDYSPLERYASVRYVTSPRELGNPDVIILPGTKNTINDLEAIKANGIFDAVKAYALRGGLVLGVCGGYQMLGKTLLDPDHVESEISSAEGFGLLDMQVVFKHEKITRQAEIIFSLPALGVNSGEKLKGYEIHQGQSTFGEDAQPFTSAIRDGAYFIDGITNPQSNVFGTYLHGLFDNPTFTHAFINYIRAAKSLPEAVFIEDYRQGQYDLLASHIRKYVDIMKVYSFMGG